MKNKEGIPAVPFTFRDTAGKIKQLKDYRGSWLLMVFHRHLGWLPCRGHVLQLRQFEKSLSEFKVKVVVVTFEAGFLARNYAEETKLKWPLLVDENRELYKAYGMLSASFWDIWGPRTWWAYLKEILHGRLPKKSTGDISQRGGDVLIDPHGIVRLHHVGQGPSDRPSPETILQIIRPKTGFHYVPFLPSKSLS